jgi:O-antigen/teichoic acid export membrane protein
MNDKSTIKKIGFVAVSNIIKLVSSILIGFIIPNILGLTNYGYYKVFILYLTYIGLFHFGFIDGIYLKYGGVDYKDLNRKKFRGYFSFLLNFEVALSIIGIIVSLVFIQDEKRFIFTLLFINLLAVNLTTYFQFISQITSRFKEFSTRIIILAITDIIVLAYMYFANVSDYKVYIVLLVGMNYLLLFWYIYTYREITFGKRDKLISNKEDIKSFFSTGITLLLANLATVLVLNVDKQIVEIFFEVDKFGVYSFAYSLLSMITVVVSAVGIVLYPTLKKTNQQNIARNYSKLNMIIISVVLLGLFGYFPLLWIIPKFLPDYIDSIVIFRIALPGLILTSSISAIKHNFFKITNKNNYFFLMSSLVILLNIGLNLSAYYIFGTTISIAISSIFGLSIWYIITEVYMVKIHKSSWVKNSLLIFIGMVLFYGLTSFNNYMLSGITYILSITSLVFIFNKEELIDAYLSWKKSRGEN